jgi:2-isopropylmalate synthase
MRSYRSALPIDGANGGLDVHGRVSELCVNLVSGAGPLPEHRPGQLICDWNEVGSPSPPSWVPEVADETLRDGLQSPSVRDPRVEDKVALLHCMVRLGIDCVAIGQPASHDRQYRDTMRLAKEIAEQKLPISAYATARTLREDIEPIIEISQRTGTPITVAAFIGSSPIRLFAENWDIDHLERLTDEAVSFAVANGLPVMYVTEDTTRTPPDTLRRLYATAVRCGATRVCICDTVGHSLPRGAAALVRFTRHAVGDPDIAIDWHGHRDRGFDLANAFAAWEAGARRCHGTVLGVGERCGNTPIEQLLVNLRLAGWTDGDLSELPEYVKLASRALGLSIPANQPIIGTDAFRTATGVHASAVMKGLAIGDATTADRIYSSVPARWVGRRQEIEIGPLSGASNVRYYLDQRGLPCDDETISIVLAKAKRQRAILPESDVRLLLQEHESDEASNTSRTSSSFFSCERW